MDVEFLPQNDLLVLSVNREDASKAEFLFMKNELAKARVKKANMWR